jgi:hypothetical protein
VVSITVNPLPNVTLTSDQSNDEFCLGTNVTFTGANAVDYEFFIDGVSVQASGVSDQYSTNLLTNAQEVSVIGIDGNGCQDTSFVTVTVNQATAGLTSDLGSTICEDVEAIFRATGGSTYEFFVDASSVQGPSAIDTFAISTLQDGEVVSVKVVDANNCEDTHAGIVMSIIAAPNVLLTSSATTVCAGEEVTFTASNASTYTFYLNGVIVPGHDGFAIFKTTTLSDGDEVYVVGNDGTCEATSSTISVTVNPLPTATLTTTPSTTVVEGANLTFTGSGGIEYTIVLPKSVVDNWNTDTLKNGDIVIVDVYAANGCIASDSDTLTILDGILPLDVQATDTEYCFGDNGVSIYIATPQDGITYELLRNSDNEQVGDSIMFNVSSPVPVRWDNITAPSGSEDYRVEGYYSSVPADRVIMNDTITVNENPLPLKLNLSPSGTVDGCNNGNGHILFVLELMILKMVLIISC